mmetsp:Transcript_19197/g.29105  ORF Transcript_19197/g.29105 Transcript_19197/m.29105 type:complete len:264 (-) Transcript_19197:375-1166(-)
MKLFFSSISMILASASAFAPPTSSSSSIAQQRSIAITTSLRATPPSSSSTNDNNNTSSSRRQLLQNTFAATSFTLATTLLPTPSGIANAATTVDPLSYATKLQQTTNALSQSLGHAILAIDGMNAQARRLGSSPHPAHPIAVLEGMSAQAKRLTRDLESSTALLEEIKDQANDITINDEKFAIVAGNVAHASSVLDGMVSQSRRLEGLANRGGGGGGGENPDDEIIYVLGVLDGLNAQVRRLNMGETFGVLDELNAKAAQTLL